MSAFADLQLGSTQVDAHKDAPLKQNKALGSGLIDLCGEIYLGLFILVLKVHVKGPGTAEDCWEEGALRWSHSSALPSGNHREGKEERSAFVPGTLSKVAS